MTETREGWALTSNGRNYRKVTGVKEHPRHWGCLTSDQRPSLPMGAFRCASQYSEREVLEQCLHNTRAAVEKARKQLANAEKDEARLMKRAKEMEGK